MIEINKNESKIIVLPFCDKTPEIDLSDALKAFYFEKSKHNTQKHNLIKGEMCEECIFGNKKISSFLSEFRDIKRDDNIYICCFYCIVDGKREQNAVFRTRNQVYVFGESFIKKDFVFDFEKEKFKICFESTFFNKNSCSLIVLSDIEEESLWVRKEKTITIFIGKEKENRKIIL